MLRGIQYDNGKVPPFIDRFLNYFNLASPTGILKGIGNECEINDPSISYGVSGYVQFKFKEGLALIYGGASYIENETDFKPHDISSGALLDGLPLTQTNTGSLGIRIDLSKPKDEQVRFYYKTTQTLVQQDLNALKSSGVYEFELYKYTSTGSVVTFTKNNEFLILTTKKELDDLKLDLSTYKITTNNTINTNITAQRIVYTTTAPTASPPAGTLIFYMGASLPGTRYNGVIYLIG